MKLISQLSKETQTPVATIRFYEKMGFFAGVRKAEVTSNNYYYYTDEVTAKLFFIKDAKAVGFSLAEIKEVIEAWYSNTLTKQAKKTILQKKIQQTEEKIKELKLVKKYLLDCMADI